MHQFWPRSKIIADFRRGMAQPDALCLVATESQKVVGFARGHSVFPSIHRGNVAEIEKQLNAPGLFGHPCDCAQYIYLAECAVRPDRQRDGIGKQLVREFHKQSGMTMLVRTLENSQMARLLEKLGGKVMQRISRGRIIVKICLPNTSGCTHAGVHSSKPPADTNPDGC